MLSVPSVLPLTLPYGSVTSVKCLAASASVSEDKRKSWGYKLKSKKSSYYYSKMIVYISKSQNSTRELLQLINNLGKVAGYNINSNIYFSLAC